MSPTLAVMEGTSATAVATIVPSFVILSLPPALVIDSVSERISVSSVASIKPEASQSLPSPSALMPMASARASVPPSQKSFAAIAVPIGPIASGAVSAVATDVDTSVPLLSTVSAPAPASMAIADESAFAAVIAPATPKMATGISTASAPADDVATISPVLMMVSLPPAMADTRSVPRYTCSGVVSIRLAAIQSRPSPSPPMPIASELAEVPPSKIEPPATATPPRTTVAASASDRASEVETSVPLLSMKSDPAPASIAVALDIEPAVDAAPPTPYIATVALVERARASDDVMTSPELVISSVPLITVLEAIPSRRTELSVDSMLPSTSQSRPSPSPLIPTAVEWASVPPSQIASVVTATPAGVTPTEIVSA